MPLCMVRVAVLILQNRHRRKALMFVPGFNYVHGWSPVRCLRYAMAVGQHKHIKCKESRVQSRETRNVR